MWEKLLEYIQQDPDLEVLIIDGTILPAHPCAAGMEKILKFKRPYGVVKVALQQKFMHLLMHLASH